MPRRHRKKIERFCSNGRPVRFKEFSDEMETILMAADVVVSMGGYNSTCEILSHRKKAVIIPRVQPVKEQVIRARRLEGLGLINMIHPENLTPQLLMKTVAQTAVQEDLLVDVEKKIDLNGLQRIGRLTRESLC